MSRRSEPIFAIRRLDSCSEDFSSELDRLCSWEAVEDHEFNDQVRTIIEHVRQSGDAALLELTARLDGFSCPSMSQLEVTAAELERAFNDLPQSESEALRFAADRIRNYHKHQTLESFSFQDELGNSLGQRVQPLARVGVYVPGGQAAYPSTVLMTVIPARLAGVDEIIMMVPAPNGEMNPLVLAAAHIAGVDRVVTIGGAQAIAALAYGTQSIPRVDKIVGPGGSFVAAAKRMVFGPVGIDVIAGPSEISIVADGSVPVDWLVWDMFSQAEHDASAQALLLSPDRGYLDQVEVRLAQLLPALKRRDIVRASLEQRGALIVCKSLDEAIEITNRIAPEHLELAVAQPKNLVGDIRNAGAIFLGRHSTEALGDYCAGPSHVLPTSGTARFASPLSVYDFLKRTSIIDCSAEGAQEVARIAAILANGEGLQAHARAAEIRLNSFDANVET